MALKAITRIKKLSKRSTDAENKMMQADQAIINIIFRELNDIESLREIERIVPSGYVHFRVILRIKELEEGLTK